MYAQRVRRALLAIALAAVFGGADQYLGSLAGHPSATAASLLSAPWLLVAFLAGWSQATPRRAMALGLVCTIAALGGYWLLTLSPLEGAQLSLRAVRGLIISQSVLVLGAFVTGPLFGWLGNRWRTDRWKLGSLALAGAVCLEPLAHAAGGSAIRSSAVWGGEVAVGLLMAIYVLAEMQVRPGATSPGPRTMIEPD
jgi:Family of unknown function (DUF6518)